MNECFREAKPLLHAPRKSVHKVVSFMGQVQQFQDIMDDMTTSTSWNGIGDGKKVEKLPDLHAVIDAKRIGHVADALTD